MMWKNIEGYEGLYQVSDDGQVRNSKGIILKPEVNKKGYLRVNLFKEGKKKKYRIHRLVAMAFIPNPDNLPQINHIDEDKSNNCLTNLEWCDCKYNNNYGTHTERMAKKHSKPVRQFDLQGNLIKEYPSLTELHKLTGFNMGNVSSCCRGRNQTSYGFIWQNVR